MAMALQHLILRTVCSGGADHVPAAPPQADDPDQQESNPSSSSSSAHRLPTQQQQRRHPGQKVGRAPPTGTTTSSTTNAAAIQQRLESLPIWCDVTVLSEVASLAGKRSNHHGENSNARTSHQGSNDDGTGLPGSSTSNVDINANLDKPHVVKRQRFNPCGMDNVLVFPSSSSSSSGSSSSTSSYLLRLSSCWTSSSLLSLGDGDDTINRGGSDTAKSEFAPTSNKEEDGSNAKGGLELLLDLPVPPHPATLAFTTAESASNGDDDGIFAESVSKIGGSSASTGTALLTVEFDLGASYKALEGIVAKKEHERRRVEDDKAKLETKRLASMMKWSMWNPLSSWWYPNGGGGGGNNSSGGIPTNRDELERMLDEMLVKRSYNAQRQQQRRQFEADGSSPNLSTPIHGREDLLILQAAMDREIRDLNIMLSGLGLVGLALVGSYVYTVRRIWNRRPSSASTSASALASGAATREQQKRQRTSSAASSDAQSYGRGFGDGVRVPPPISTIQIVKDTVVQGFGMANIGDALKAAVRAGAASVSASFSPSKSDGESVSTAPSTPETPSPRAKKQVGQRQHQRQVKEQELKGKEESPQEAAKRMEAEKKKRTSPERKEIINALLARVKAPTPVKPAEEDEGGKNNTTAGKKKIPTAVMATPEKNPAKQKQTAGKVNEEQNAPITPITSRRPMVGRKPVGSKVGGAFTSVPDDESSAAVTPASNQTPDIFAPSSRASAIDFGGILGGGSNAATKTPALTPMRNKDGGVRGEGSGKLGQSKSNAISADPRGSPSFAEMLLQKQQQLTPPKEEPSNKPAVQGSISLGGSLKKKKVLPQRQKKQQQSKPRRKLTPPPKSNVGDASASAASGGFEDGSGNDTMIQGRNLNDAIENTFFRDYWDE